MIAGDTGHKVYLFWHSRLIAKDSWRENCKDNHDPADGNHQTSERLQILAIEQLNINQWNHLPTSKGMKI